MKRKQIYIAEEQERVLKEMAAERSVPEAVLIREAVAEYIADHVESAEPIESMEDHPIWALVGIGRNPDAPTDGSINHDYYLYGAPKDEQ